MAAAPFYVPSSSAQGLIFPTCSPALVSLWFFDSSCPDGCEVVSHRGSDLYFPDD